MDAAQELIDSTPEALVRIPSPPMADFVEGYLPMKQRVLVRFGGTGLGLTLAERQPKGVSGARVR